MRLDWPPLQLAVPVAVDGRHFAAVAQLALDGQFAPGSVPMLAVARRVR